MRGLESLNRRCLAVSSLESQEDEGEARSLPGQQTRHYDAGRATVSGGWRRFSFAPRPLRAEDSLCGHSSSVPGRGPLMTSWKTCRWLLSAALTGVLVWGPRAAEPPPPAEGSALVLIDAGGKEQKLKAWKFV